MSPLKDLIVLELASVLAGPGVGQFFAELGAQVIKVENLRSGGDVTRSWRSAEEDTDDRSAYFCSVNWGKQSIALDLQTQEARDIVHAIARRADIVLASFKPGDAEKLGVDYATLSRQNDSIIYGQITGYGSDIHRVGFDAIIQAEAGFMSMNGQPGGPSLKMPVALMDILAGHHLKEALLLAMLEKTHTGKGKLVEVSLFHAALASLANQASNYLVTGTIPGKTGSAHPNIAPYGDVYRTADDREVLLAVGTDKQFGALCKVLGVADLPEDPRFSDNISRVRNREALGGLLSNAIRQVTAEKFLRDLEREKVPAGQIRNVQEVMNDPVVDGLRLSGDDRLGLRTFAAHPPARISHLLPPPHLGEHTQSILTEMLKISPNRVKTLMDSHIVG